MDEHTFNLRTWLSRLGMKGGRVPPILPGVQPVQMVGDASLIVPPMLPPTGYAGGGVACVAPAFSGLSIYSGAPAGCFIRTLTVSPAASGRFTLKIQDTDLTWGTGPTVHNAMQMAEDSTTSVVRSGTVAAGITPNNAYPHAYTRTTEDNLIDVDLILIPQGKYLVMTHAVAGADLWFRVIFQDLPAAPGPR